MNKKIELIDNLEFVDKIILNGKIGYVKTNDENKKTIGVQNVIKKVTFKGEEIIDTNTGFPLTKEMEDKIGWNNHYASVQFVIGDTVIDPTKVEETIIESLYGETDSYYSHHYSDLTGYLWTEEGFKVGGHDIPKILKSNIDKYIHMEIDIYKDKNEE